MNERGADQQSEAERENGPVIRREYVRQVQSRPTAGLCPAITCGGPRVASFRQLDRSVGEFDLSPGQFSLLVFLDANPGVSQKTASREIGVDTSTLSPVLTARSERGLVRRSRAEHDRRNYAMVPDAGRRGTAGGDARAHRSAGGPDGRRPCAPASARPCSTCCGG